MKEHSLKTRGITGKLRRCISLLLVLSLVLPGALPVQAAENGSSEILQETIRLEDEESVPETAAPEMEESIPGTAALENEDTSPEAVVSGNGETDTAAEELQNPVQQMIDALPDTVTEENAEDVRAQLTAIDEAKAELSDEELEALDITKYQAAVEALLKLEGMAGANEAETVNGTYDVSTGDVIISEDGDYTVTGTSSTYRIKVLSGVSANITLKNVNIDRSDAKENKSAFYIEENSPGNVTVILEGENVLKSGDYCAGLNKGGSEGSGSLTITGSGSLTAVGSYEGAGIGGGRNSCSNITISGGKINATGGMRGAGIGGGSEPGEVTITGGEVIAVGGEEAAGIGGGAGVGKVIITGGKVTATGGRCGAGIGSGWDYDPPKGIVSISGGEINATGGQYGAGIGGGMDGIGEVTISGGKVTAVGGEKGEGIGHGWVDVDEEAKGSFTTTETGSALITASSIGDQSGKESGAWKGIIIEGKEGGVYGKISLAESITIPQDVSLTVLEDAALTIPADMALTNNGTLTNQGILTIAKHGSLTGSGSLAGSGTFMTGNLTEDMISVPTGLVYNDSIIETIRQQTSVTTSVCGKDFHEDTGAWTQSVVRDPGSALSYTVAYTHTDGTRISKNVTVAKSGTEFAEGAVKTYSGSTETTEFFYGETITVKADPTPTGQAPLRRMALASTLAEPAAGQMALYCDGVQLCSPVSAGGDGLYTMAVSVKELISAGKEYGEHTLTVKFVGTDAMADAEASVNVTLKPSELIVVGGEEGTDYVHENRVLKIKSGTPLTISNRDPATAVKERIEVQNIASADITLKDVNIDVSALPDTAAFLIAESAKDVTVKLEGQNTLKSGKNCAGLQRDLSVYRTESVTISGSGSLDATGGEYGAGIGGGNDRVGRNITISGGTVEATGGRLGAGIGGGYSKPGVYITISGGTVKATGGENGAGIGGGFGGEGDTITISGGTVKAIGVANGAGIGGGSERSGVDITISGGTVEAGSDSGAGIGQGSGSKGKDSFSTGEQGNAFITASTSDITVSSITDTSSSDSWSGIIFQGDAGQVYGNQTLATSQEVTAGKTLTIPAGISLTIPAGVSLTNNGTIINHGSLIIDKGGRISGTGTISGDGTFTVKELTEEMGSLSTDVIYNGKDQSEAVKNALAVTICGQPFRLDTAVMAALTVTGQDDLNYTVTYTPDDGGAAITQTVTVKPAPLTIGYVHMSSKAYDGTCYDLVADLDLKGYVEGHGLRFRRDFTATAVYDTPEVGTNKWVTITVTLADTVTNYCLPENVCRVQTGIIRKRPLDETDTTITLPQEKYVWDGESKPVAPVPTGVSFEMNGETYEIQPDEYTVSYENNNKFGDKAAVVVTINGKSYEGTVRKYFSIICPHDDTTDGQCNVCGHLADIVVKADGGPFYYFEPVDMAAAWEKACSSYAGEAVTVEVQHTTAWDSPLVLEGGEKIDLRIKDYRQSFDATVNVTDGELTMTSGIPADASGCVVNLSGTGKFTLNNGAVKDVSMAGGQFTMNSGRLYGDLKVGDAASQLTVNNGEIHSVILEADADVSITGGSIDSLTAAASLTKTKITGGSFGSITVPEGTGVGMLLPEGYIYCDELGAKIEDTSVSTVSKVTVMKDSAHTISELDLREKASGYGDLETDGYHWTNESGAWALSLKDCAVTGSVIFPDDIGEITIHLEGRNQVGGFFAVKGIRWSGYDRDPTYPFNFVFTGTGSLRVAGLLGGSSANGNKITVESGATVNASGGIIVAEGTLTVRGKVSAVAVRDVAIRAGKLFIDGGSLKVSGVSGVYLNGIYNGNERDYSDVFVMTGSGTLAADCTDYNILVETNRPLDAKEQKAVFRFPDGNYIPAGYSLRYASNGNNNLMSIVRPTVTDEDILSRKNMGGSLTLERQPYSVMLVQERMPYTGEAVEPEVTVTDIDNKVLSPDNYKVSYSDNTQIGTGTVTVTGRNGHDFSMTLSFTIYCPHTSFAEADGKCEVCGETVVAQVAESGHTANYTDLAAAWEELQGKTAELTLLSSQEVQDTLILSAGTDLTLQMKEGVTLNSSWYDTDTVRVEGTLRVKSGSLQSDQSKAVFVQGGMLEVTGGALGRVKVNDGTASISGGEVDYLDIYSRSGVSSVSGGTVRRVDINYGAFARISGGTMEQLNIYDSAKAIMSGGRIETEFCKPSSADITFASMLADGYAYKLAGGWLTSEPEGDTLTGPIEILPAPVKVTGQKATPEAVEVGYTESPVLTVEAEAAGEGELTYQWYQVNAETAEGAGGESTGGEAAGGTAAGEAITGATGSTYTLPDGLAIGEYQYYCAVTCDGYTVNSGTITVAVKKRTFAVTIETDGNCRINAVLVDSEDGEDAGILVQNGDRVPEGAILKVTTTANEGYELTSSPAQSSYTVTENLTLYAAASPITYTLTVKHENGAEPEVDIGNLTAIPRDTTVTLIAGAADEGYEFIGWYQPNGKLLADSAEYCVSVNTDLSVEARYQKKSGVVTFMANDRIVDTFTGTEITDGDFPAAPSAYSGFEFTGWDQTAADVNAVLADGQSVTVTAQFAPVKQTSVITVYNGEAETPETVTLEESEIYTVKAAPVEGKNFAYWMLGDTILTYGQTASIFVVSDCTLKAVYSTEVTEAIGTALLKTAVYHADTKKLAMVAYLTVPEGCRINNAGLLAVSESYNGYGPEQDLTFDNAQYIKTSVAAVGKSAPVTYTWTKSSVSIGDTWYARAYVTYEDADGQQHTVYGDRVTVTAGEDYDAAEKGTAKITSSSYDSSTKRAKFVAYTTVPEGAVISKAGLVAASSSLDANNTILTAENAEYVKASTLAVGKSAPVTYTWTKSKVNSGDIWYVRAYLVYTLNGTEHTVYGALVSFKAQ